MPKVLNNVREGILLVGRDMLSQSGYGDFSVRLVANRCGIGVGTLYNYFPSKQHLVAAILRAEWDIHLRRMTQLSKAKDNLNGRLIAIYGELRLFLQGIHNTWVGGIGGTVDSAELAEIQEERNMVRLQLVEIIAPALEQDKRWLADGISRLFLSYAGEPQGDDDRLLRILEQLLD